MRDSGGALIAAALILGLSFLGGAWLIKSSLDEGSAQVAGVREVLAALDERLGGSAPSRPTRAARRGPDPEERHEIDVDGAPTWGPADAKVTVVEWSDFQCPFCSRVWPTLQRLRADYGDDVRLVFKHLPLAMHSKAPEAHAAAEAAHRQGKFWEMHNRIFGNQRQLSVSRYEEYAREIGLDVEQFKEDMRSASVRQRIDADLAAARALGVTGTPAFFVNGRFLSGAKPYASFKAIVEEELERS